MDRNTMIVAVTAIIAAVIVALAVILIQQSVPPSPITQNVTTLPTCAQQSGSICPSSEGCPGIWMSASDNNRCCSARCAAQPVVTPPTPPQSNIQPTGKPLLWKIESPGKKVSYLFGTIHVPDDRVLALSKTVGSALESADEFCAEIPLDSQTQMNVLSLSTLPEGKKLSTVLPRDIYEHADRIVRSKGLSMTYFESFKIWAFAGVVELIDYFWDMVGKKPLDMYLYSVATSMGKQTCGVETVEEQIGMFEAFSDSEQAQLLESTLDAVDAYAANGTNPTEEMILLYLSGDDLELLAVSTESTNESDPLMERFSNVLVNQRNVRMADRIAAKISASNKSFFFAIGSAHMPGDDGIVELLRQKGFIVTRVVLTTQDEKSLWVSGVSGAAPGDWCPAGQTEIYPISGMGDVPVQFIGLEMHNGKQMCHMVATYDMMGEAVPLDIWFDEQGDYDIGGLGDMGSADAGSMDLFGF